MATLMELLSEGKYVSGEEMSRCLGITRAAVWKQIEALRAQGYVIEAAGKKGYRLDAGDRLDAALWQHQLNTTALGRGEVLVEQTVTSTNVVIRQMAANGAPHGSLCIGETQTAGRGRLGRRWESPAGAGLWQTVLLRPRIASELAPMLTFCAALAMAGAVEDSCGIAPLIKWPNDLVLDGRKVCGILLEFTGDLSGIESVAVGVGLNVRRSAYPAELTDRAIALEEVCTPPPRRVILCRYLERLEAAVTTLEAQGFAGLEADYLRRSCTIGSRVRVVSTIADYEALAVGLDQNGALIVRTDDGVEKHVLSGDVSVRGIMGYV